MELKKEKNKITMHLDGEEIGKITWTEESNILYVNHTFVDPVHRGKDYARILVDAVVAYARSEKKKIIPICPYVVKVLNRYDEYSDILEKQS